MTNKDQNSNHSDPDFDDRLKAARKKAIDQGIVEPKAEEVEKDDADMRSGFSAAYKMGVELVAGVVVGVFIGTWLDKYFQTGPVFLLVFLVLGFAAGLLNVFRSAQRMHADLHVSAEQDKRPIKTRK